MRLPSSHSDFRALALDRVTNADIREGVKSRLQVCLGGSFLQQGLPHSYGVLPIDTQHLDGGSSDGGPPHQKGAIPAEMLLPTVMPGME